MQEMASHYNTVQRTGHAADEGSGFHPHHLKKARIEPGSRGLDGGPNPHHMTPPEIHAMNSLQQNLSALTPQQQNQLKYLQQKFHLMTQHQKQKFTPAQINPDNKMLPDHLMPPGLNQNIPRIHSSLQQATNGQLSVHQPPALKPESIRSTAASFLSEVDLETLLYPKNSPTTFAEELIHGKPLSAPS